LQKSISHTPKAKEEISKKTREIFADFSADGAVTGANTYTACI
jgi:hypothetical protein